MRLVRAALALLLLGAATSASAQEAPGLRLDHVAVAVRSLDSAVETYGARLGFTLKPGRPHPNGLRNAFAKLEDGSYLELITAERATDDLSRFYTRFLEQREGGAFLALDADSLARFAAELRDRGHAGTLQDHTPAFSILSFAGSALHPVFFIEYGTPVRDDPALLRHLNTAVGLESVWLAEGPFRALAAALDLAAAPCGDDGIALDRGVVSAATVEGTAPVLGVTVRVRDLVAASQSIHRGTGEDLPVRSDERGRSVMVPPRLTHGIWIELLEPALRR